MADNVLVTGAFGFIGRHVCRILAERGERVTGIGHGDWSRREWSKWGLSDWRAADVDLDSLLTYAGTPDKIIHCAGGGSVGFSMTHPFQDHQRTVGAALAVLEFVRLHAPGAGIAYPSSAAVYGEAKELPIKVDSVLNPTSPYGVNKKIAEELCLSYSRHFGVRTAIVRLFSIYGPGLRKQLLWDGCRKLMDGDTTFFGTGEELRDWLHIDDAAPLLCLAADLASAPGTVMNGASGQGVPVRDILGRLFLGFGRTDRPHFSGLGKAGDPTHYVADMSGTEKLGFRPGVGWREGVAGYVEWFKREHK